MRPAIVLADAGREDWVLCQVTSNPYSDMRAVTLSDRDFDAGSLQRKSYARPGKLFTANRGLISAQVGILKDEPFAQLVEAVVTLLKPDAQQ